ncbi:GDP-mannose 4,6-dehydratase [Niveispirillum fermenti]|uniref:GDP-mannose 4,6-dehydratase n=1 Tax=Niveispirillum fermenti TaxID=1233113 RepID=UPI003A85084F
MRFSGKKVVVTGADGFIGSHLVERLVAAGARVRALAFYNSWGSSGWLEDVPAETLRSVEIVHGDIRDAGMVASLLRGQELVFHLASLIGIPYSYAAPRSYVDTNVTGTLNVLEACRGSDTLERLIHTSTSEVYGSARHVPIDEGHPLTGQSPYSASKIAADKMAESYHLSFGLPVVTARPFNTFGPRQTARAIIPTVIAQVLSGAPVLRLGALDPTRDFNYVGDTVEGFLALAGAEGVVGRTLNIGSGSEVSIGDTVALIMRLCGREVPIQQDDQRLRPAASEVERLLADNRLIRELTGWSPQVGFQEGLRRTIDWIGRNPNRFSPQEFAR